MEQLEQLVCRSYEYRLAGLKCRSHDRVDVDTPGEIFKCLYTCSPQL
jgi:hypothetical protein